MFYVCFTYPRINIITVLNEMKIILYEISRVVTDRATRGICIYAQFRGVRRTGSTRVISFRGTRKRYAFSRRGIGRNVIALSGYR